MHGLRPSRAWAPAMVVLGAVIAALLAFPARGPAQCGGVYSAEPHHRHHSQPPPLAIGDSTMLLALYDPARIGYDANAHGCRQFSEALALLRARKAHHTLPHLVVLALGANGSITHQDIGRALGVLCCSRLLGLVTPRELGGGSGADAATIREEARRHLKRILLLDWVRYSAGHSNCFQPEGLHLTTAGATAFTHLMARGLRHAYPPHKKRRKKHRHHPHARSARQRGSSGPCQRALPAAAHRCGAGQGRALLISQL